ncbi:uncharacterized protein LOC120902356 isoform X1 [Anopheles arabiensis]|uniref:Uncharacterized protein n=1 Tax=Anopheles arabiensis TaxID=7173 RepID=A0A182IGN0_ANOAR|nr:uncharacterized protein LOC120902356 isoform X1 [Anopheles arabiensis]
MSATPDRQSITSYKLKSPRTPTSPGNVATLRIQEAIASIIELHQKWIQAADKGISYCNAIRNTKKNILPQSATTDPDPYPENLQLYCKNLMVMVTIMEDVKTNALVAMAKIKSLNEFFAHHDVIGCTWNYRKTLDAVEQIISSYTREINLRKFVAEQIGHSTTLDHLTYVAISWNHGIDIERERESIIRMMSFEYKFTS